LQNNDQEQQGVSSVNNVFSASGLKNGEPTPDTSRWQSVDVVPAEGYAPLDPDPAAGFLVDRFEQAVAAAPDRAAVITDTETLTLAEFNGQANAIAFRLLEIGSLPGSLIALCMAHGSEKMAAAIGVLKASSAYVSIDPIHTDQGIFDLLAHSRPTIVLTDEENRKRVRRLADPSVAVVAATSVLVQSVADDPAHAVTAESVLNLSYTSGSTGKPKAAIRTHGNELNVIASVAEINKIGAGDRVAFLQGFWMSHFLGPLITGATVHPFDLRLAGLGALKAWLLRHRITCYGGIVTGFRQFLETLQPNDIFPDMRIVSVTGEPLYRTDLERFDRAFPSECAFLNWYAATEHQTITGFVADRTKLPADGDIVPLGGPAPFMDVVLVDEHSDPVPQGTIGEVVVRGTELSPGYWNNPALSAKVWRADPSVPGQRMYHSGDLAVMDETGCLHVRGRADQQIKVRGYRVIPGEVENLLTGHPAIKAAVVVLDNVSFDTDRLVGYIVGETDSIPTTAELRAYLGRRLPDYMVPGVFMPVAGFDLTATGKVNRRTLPPPKIDIQARTGDFIAPNGDVETALKEIWQDLLVEEGISVEDDFFLIGGDSLKALTMILKVEERLGRQLPFESLWLQGSTIRALARAIAGEAPSAGWGQALALQSQGEKPALFIATLNSTAGHYCVSLVQRLGADQPVYGLPPKGVGGSELPDLSIEEMADHCISMMRQVQPDGPYRIMGYSAAGLLAFETARLLHAQGEEVSKLVLLDSDPPGAIDLLAGEVLLKPRKAARVAGSLIGQALGLSAPDGAVARQAMQTGARVRYRPKPYSGGAILVLASERQNNAELARRWRRLIKGDLVVEEVSGDHISMMQEPGIGELARTLMRQLED
jgi:amino acid adenylation domain-containing protein